MSDLEKISTGPQREPAPTGSPSLSFQLQAELDRLRAEDHPWQAGRNAKILVKYPDFRVLLIALRAGAHLVEHRAAGSISVQTISGHVRIRAADRSFDLRDGALLALEPDMPHDVEALVESAILITIAWPGDERR